MKKMDLIKYYQHSCHLLQQEKVELIKLDNKFYDMSFTYNKYSDHAYRCKNMDVSFCYLNGKLHDKLYEDDRRRYVECWFNRGIIHNSEGFAYMLNDVLGREEKAIITNGRLKNIITNLLFETYYEGYTKKEIVYDKIVYNYDDVDCSLSYIFTLMLGMSCELKLDVVYDESDFVEDPKARFSSLRLFFPAEERKIENQIERTEKLKFEIGYELEDEYLDD